jgi:hypothetical protein
MLHIKQPATAHILMSLVFFASLLSGCSDSGTSTSSASTSSLALSGAPAGDAAAGVNYTFQPTVSQSTGAVTFSIAGQPAWATFNSTTGQLSGTPTSSEVGTTANVTITASDGGNTASIGPFNIIVTVAEGSAGSATVSWSPPSEDMTVGYYIYYGTSADALTQIISVTGSDTTTYVVGNLAPGTYYFSVSGFTSQGIVSPPSEVASTTI